jgi:hypothetical protein
LKARRQVATRGNISVSFGEGAPLGNPNCLLPKKACPSRAVLLTFENSDSPHACPDINPGIRTGGAQVPQLDHPHRRPLPHPPALIIHHPSSTIRFHPLPEDGRNPLDGWFLAKMMFAKTGQTGDKTIHHLLGQEQQERMNKKCLSERDICTKFVTPAIIDAKKIKETGYNLDIKNPHDPGTTVGDPDKLLAEYQQLLAVVNETREKLRRELETALTR